jgi:gliding motility-associated-like protein
LNLRQFIFAILLVACSYANAQLEASVWYFGRNAGLDFRGGNPVALTDGALDTREGCATISDAMGNLLFYTNGYTVWDRNHNIMPNGNFLGGHDSSTQSSIIVPNPGNPDLFYIFTTPAIFMLGDPGLRYSEVDMTLNGGLGDINGTKNVLIHAPVPEKVTAVEHANGTDIWVVTHHWGNDAFAAYQVTAAGINMTPVISNTGFDMDYRTVGQEVEFSMGAIKISPDGTKLAIAHNKLGVELFDFDAATGQVSNPIRLREDDQEYYGVEFSPNSEVLYISVGAGSLLQYDLNAMDIPGSEFEIVDDPLIFGLQLGIDGKMYIALDFVPYLAAVNQPNVVGAGCDFQLQAVDLDTGISFFALPPFIQSYFLVTFEAENFCLGDGTEFSIDTSDPITSIIWNFGDGNTSADEEPIHVYAAAGTYTVSVTVNTTTETKTETKDITIYETPVANMPIDLIGCTSYGSYNLDMPSFDTTVLGAQDPNDFSVAYFLTQADADANVNALSALHSFDYGTTPVYVRVSNRSNSQCYNTTQFNIIAQEAPLVNTIMDWTVCDDDTDGLFTFDLSQKNTEIFNGQDETKFEILYFPTQADADAGTNALPLNYTNTAATETIFVRFQNSTYTDCYRTGSFVIEVIPGVTANQPTDLSLCDDNNDGQAIFDLTQTETEIIGTQNPNSLNLSYHESQADADSGANPLNASSYLSSAYQNTIYVRVENASDTACYATTSFDLNIYDMPAVPQVADWQVCDDNNDGLFLFNVSEKETEILNGTTGTNISFYSSQLDAETAQNGITGNYQNTSNPQTIYFRLENLNNAQCYSVSSFQIQVFDTPTAYTASDIIICDTEEKGRYYFDLSEKDDEVLNGQDPLYYDVSYHSSENDALNNVSLLSKADYQNTNPNETLWARVQHTDLESCFDVSSFNLIVNPLPQMNMEERYVICPDSPDLVIDGGVFESYSWRDSNGIEIGNQATLDITSLGNYSLTITQTTNGITCENTAYFEVVSSGAPETLEVDLNGFSDEVQLELLATGTGEFEYSIDGENYQPSSSFRVFPGQYTVYVRDIYECRTITEEITVMGYQRFFTPNGDNVHEFWHIIGAEMHADAQLFIYDRYGKLLKQLPINSEGWDGTYLGQPMPASDYWFRFVYNQNQVFTGHFTLKR